MTRYCGVWPVWGRAILSTKELRDDSAMSHPTLTFESIRARPILLQMRRPVVARIATITAWPMIVIDLTTKEGIVGRSYLEPYVAKAMNYLVPALNDLGEL
jgi:mandelate racemase